MAILIQLRNDTAANWELENPILAQGEFAVENDTGYFKIGDGTTAWNDLVYYIGPTSDLGNTNLSMYVNYKVPSAGTYQVSIPSGTYSAVLAGTTAATIGSYTVEPAQAPQTLFLESPISSIVFSAAGVFPESWQTRNAGISTQLTYGLAYGNSIYMLAAWDYGIRVSTDGATWVTRNSPIYNHDVAFGGGRFVAVGNNNLITSTTNDGVTWSSAVRVSGSQGPYGGPNHTALKVIYSPEGSGVFVGTTSWHGNYCGSCCYGDNYSWVFASTNGGVSWANKLGIYNATNNNTCDNGAWNFIGAAYGNPSGQGQGTFIVAMADGRIFTSTLASDLTIWAERTSNISMSPIRALGYGFGQFVAGGDSGVLKTSTDTLTWTTRANPFGTESFRRFLTNDSFIVAVGTGGRLITSTDAITWTLRDSNFGATEIYSIAYGNNEYMLGGSNGVIKQSISASSENVSQILSLEYKGPIINL